MAKFCRKQINSTYKGASLIGGIVSDPWAPSGDAAADDARAPPHGGDAPAAARRRDLARVRLRPSRRLLPTSRVRDVRAHGTARHGGRRQPTCLNIPLTSE